MQLPDTIKAHVRLQPLDPCPPSQPDENAPQPAHLLNAASAAKTMAADGTEQCTKVAGNLVLSITDAQYADK